MQVTTYLEDYMKLYSNMNNLGCNKSYREGELKIDLILFCSFLQFL